MSKLFQMTKKVVIIHCWDGTPDYCWYPWLKKNLELKGFFVKVPTMPETGLPKQKLWVQKMEKVIGQPSSNLILVGHSIGCITILRYLESLKEGQSIAGAVLIAGFISDLGFKELKNYFETPLNLEKVKSHCSKFVAIYSDNDPYVDLKYGYEFKEKLGAKLIVKSKKGHFSGAVDDEKSCTKLPDVLNSVLEISGKTKA